MALGSVGALANGCAMPLFAIAFGNYTDGFGADEALAEARRAALRFVYLSAAVFVAFYLQAACWMRTGIRQAGSMRLAFLHAVMRQDVAFFEHHTSAGACQRACGARAGLRAHMAATSRRTASTHMCFLSLTHPAGLLLQTLNDDTAAFQKAVSERLGIFLQHVTTFVVGFAVAFWRGAHKGCQQAALCAAGGGGGLC
jgi:ATP-binding cassette subfamily B (MDR/TAP) protein 1